MEATTTVVMDRHKRIQGASLFLNERNKNYPVFKGLNTIGRNKSAVIDIKDLSISQSQAIIVIVDEHQHFLSDLNSSNGTFLHGTKLIPFKLYELTHDANITFGKISGKYLKPSHVDTTIHLNNTGTMDLTQNMTQNFYGATTQLVLDTTFGDHEFVRPKSRNNDSFTTCTQPPPIDSYVVIPEANIHEIATQVVEYPQKMPLVTDPVHCEAVEESIVDSNIHDEPTQVVVLPKFMKTTHDDVEVIGESTIVDNPVAKVASQTDNIEKENTVDVATEVENPSSSESKSQLDSQTTNIGSNDNYLENTKLHYVSSRNSLHSSQVASTSRIDESCEINDSVIENTSGGNVVVEESIINDNVAEEQLDDNSIGSEDLLMDFQATNNEIVSPSINMHGKLSPKDQDSEDIVEPRKKVPPKLISDDESDIDETQEIGVKKKRISKIDSDSETDCEDNVPDIAAVQSNRINFPLDSVTSDADEKSVLAKSCKTVEASDSDTDIEDGTFEGNKLKSGTNNLNDTDYIPATQDAFAAAFKYKSNMEDNSERQSSEESFKLGLTELMVDNDNDYSNNEIVEQKDIQDNTINVNENKDLDENSITSAKGKLKEEKNKSNDPLDASEKEPNQIVVVTDCKENLYESPTQKVEQNTKCTKPVDTSANNSKFEENLLDQSDDFILPTQDLRFLNLNSLYTGKIKDNVSTEISVENKTASPEIPLNKNIYDIPTQDICSTNEKISMGHGKNLKLIEQKLPELTEDEYLMATQKIVENESPFKVPSKKFTFKKKCVVLEDSMSTILSSDNDDDVYVAATQKLELSRQSNTETNENDNDDVYIQPTQCLNFEKKESGAPAEEDIYILATQQIECNTIVNDITKGKNGNLELEDSYCLPTQIISNEINSNSQSEVSELTKNIETSTPPVSHRPKNPLSHVLNSNHAHSGQSSSSNKLEEGEQDCPNQKSRKSSKLKQVMITADAVETLSQIEAFVKKPLVKFENESNQDISSCKEPLKCKQEKTKNNVKKETIETCATVERKGDNVETLSQIEAFIKNPESDQTNLKSHKNPIKKSIPTELNISNNKIVRNEGNNENIETDSDKNTSTMNDTMGNSVDREIRSDIDQSFALLESKISKVKRNSRMHTGLEPVIVVPLNRRSMAIAETSRIEEVPDTRASRKSVRAIIKSKAVSRKSKKNSEADTSNTFIPTKRTRTSIQENHMSAINKRLSRCTVTKKQDVENNNENTEKSLVQQSTASIESTNKDNTRATRKTRTNQELLSINPDNFDQKTKSGNRSKLKEDSVTIENSKHSTFQHETPSKRKRNAANADHSNASTDQLSSPKRQHRNATTENLTSSAERAKRKQKHKVVFTMMDDSVLESSIRRIGGSVVDSVDASTVLITQQVKRSQKLLTAVGQGKPICSPEWIQASVKNHDFLDPWDFILIDEEAQQKWNFSLSESLQRAKETKLLRNYNFQIMVTKAVDVLKGAIESCGGKVLSRHPGKKLEGTFVIIASPEYKTKYSKLLKQHPEVKVVDPEAIFEGVLRQELRLSRHSLI